MAGGGGLSMDSDPIGSFFLHKPTVLNSFPEDNNNNNNNTNHHHKWKLSPNNNNMDDTVSTKRLSSPTCGSTTNILPFQVNLSSCSNDNNHDPAPSHDNKREEVDFFTHNNNNINKDDNNLASVSTSIPDNDHSTTSTMLEFKVNVSDPSSISYYIIICMYVYILCIWYRLVALNCISF